jgi:hypothetical protein
MLRLITCQDATLLLDLRAEQALPKGQRMGLWLHMCYCRHCNRYGRQTALVAAWARNAAAARAAAGPTLSAAAKERMRERLTAAQ